MNYSTEHITSGLKAARESAGLSQHTLGLRVGVPQGHISKIENGTVDLRLSSLIALARVLDLELMLVPRNAVGAIQSVIRGIDRVARGREHPSRDILRPAYRLDEEDHV